jgi:glycosyltransferase involved in cell wall biosynthesis
MRVFVVVPAFREAERIGGVLGAMPPLVHRIIVVDDASDDGTFDVARECVDPRVVVLRHERNLGVGAAIATGYRHALALEADADPRDAFVVMAGDGQMDPADLPALVAPIARGDAGYVKGDRFADASRIPRARYWGGQVLTQLTRRALGVDVHDSQCGYTAIAREACAALDLNALWPRFGYPNDLLAMLARRRVVIAEVPVRPLYFGRNHLGARHVPVIVGVIARAWLTRLRG